MPDPAAVTRIGTARARAAEWVADYRAAHPEVLGAFCTGSSLEAADDEPLAVGSDIDVVVVVPGEPPGKLGKLEHRGVLLDVSFVGWPEVSDAEAVARTHYLAPSFASPAGPGLIADRDGRLHAVAERVETLWARQDVVWARSGGVLRRMQRGLARVGEGGPWPAQVLGAVFPLSLSTHVLLVAALRNPTVRLRYLAARRLLAERDLQATYPELLDHLGCRRVTGIEVRGHLDAMTAAFDAAVRLRAGTGLPFAADLSPAARPAAVQATAALVRAGDHREAVFWLVVTFARSLLALRAAAPAVAAEHAEPFLAATTELIGVASASDLRRRATEVRRFLPRLDGLARRVLTG